MEHSKPLVIELFAGLFGWGEGFIAEGYQTLGFDIVNMFKVVGIERNPEFNLVIQDVLTIHGSQFKDATLIVASPPCQEFSYMAMPWSLAKQKERDLLEGRDDPKRLTALFDACFRIQREAIEAAGHHIPLIVENVRGAQKWVGRSRFNYGSFHLWGDVPALMPISKNLGVKAPKMNCINQEKIFCDCENPQPDAGCALISNECPIHNQNPMPNQDGIKHDGSGWNENRTLKSSGQMVQDGRKQGGDWFNAESGGISRTTGSKSNARKAASAMIAKIPLPLSQYIAAHFRQ